MTALALLLVALGVSGPLDLAGDQEAARRFEELRAQFPRRNKADSIAALERLVAEHPRSEAGARAMLWLGDLARQAGEGARARGFYERTHTGFGPEVTRLAARGLGDVDMGAGHFRRARAFYDEALTGASGLLQIELVQKRALSIKMEVRFWLAALAWATVLGALAFFVAGARPWKRSPRSPLAPPVEVAYVFPVYAVLIAGCIGRDPDVLRALAIFATGSLVLLWGWALRPQGAARLALLATAHVALFYAGIHTAGIIDSLLATVGAGAVAG